MGIEYTVQELSPEEYWVILAVLVITSAISLYRGFEKIRQARWLENIPTSRIRSAHQGFVELEGECLVGTGGMLTAPISGVHCVWYAYRVERKQDKNWRTVKQGISEACFRLDDGTGTVSIDPAGATVMVEDSHTWYGGSERIHSNTLSFVIGHGRYRYTERRIEAGDHLVVQGDFRSSHADGDSRLPDMSGQNVSRSELSQHRLNKPTDGSLPYLVSNERQIALIGRLRRGGWISLGVFMVTGILVVYMLTQPTLS